MDILQKQEMVNIEQEFYDTFGIEKRCTRPKDCVSKGICRSADACALYTYPKITSDILLELICILNETACEVLAAENIEDLKNEILETCIKVYNTPILTSDGDEYDNYTIYNKIQQLFKGSEQQ